MATDKDNRNPSLQAEQECQSASRQWLLLSLAAIFVIAVGVGATFYLYENVFRPGALPGIELSLGKSRVSRPQGARYTLKPVPAKPANSSIRVRSNSHGQRQ